MPKLLSISNVLLLFALSILVGAGLSRLLGGDGVPHHWFYDGVSYVAWATAVIMLITEFFSGVRWLPVIAVVALIVGSATSDDGAPSWATAVSWLVGWIAVAWWFALLAARERENR